MSSAKQILTLDPSTIYPPPRNRQSPLSRTENACATFSWHGHPAHVRGTPRIRPILRSKQQKRSALPRLRSSDRHTPPFLSGVSPWILFPISVKLKATETCMRQKSAIPIIDIFAGPGGLGRVHEQRSNNRLRAGTRGILTPSCSNTNLLNGIHCAA